MQTRTVTKDKTNDKDKATAARLAKSFGKAILTDGDVEIFPGFTLPMEEAVALIRNAHDDEDIAGGTLEERLAHYLRNPFIDKIVDTSRRTFAPARLVNS